MTKENAEKLYKHFVETGQRDKANELKVAYGFEEIVEEAPKEEKKKLKK